MANEKSKAAVRRYKDAHAALDANSRKEEAAGINEETPEYLKLNQAAAEAAADPDRPLWHKLTLG